MTGSVVATVVAVLAIVILGASALYAMRRLLGSADPGSGQTSDARGQALAALYRARQELQQRTESGGGDAPGPEASESSGDDG